MSRKTARDEARYLLVLRDRCALLPDGRCPICGGEWRGRDSCAHGWSDVAKANDRFLLEYGRRVARGGAS